MLTNSLNEKKSRFERFLNQYLETMQAPPVLAQASKHVLLSGGKRFRPLLVYTVAESIHPQANVDFAALCVELFHSASLIADDLPCMDNENQRRGKETLHVLFDEATALLTSYGMISAAFEMIIKSQQAFQKDFLCKDGEERLSLALTVAAEGAGFSGATGGQYLDLFSSEQNQKALEETLVKKTALLFEVCFSLGYLFAGGEIAMVPSLRLCALHFGLAFQIADDIADFEQDKEKESKCSSVVVMGIENALAWYEENKEKSQQLAQKIGIFTADFALFFKLMDSRVLQKAKQLQLTPLP